MILFAFFLSGKEGSVTHSHFSFFPKFIIIIVVVVVIVKRIDLSTKNRKESRSYGV